METLYEFKSLVFGLNHLITGQKHNKRQISLAVDIHPSYFSRALKGQASLSQQQIFRLAEFFQLNETQTQYLILLWSHHQSERASEKTFFAKQIQKIQEQKQNVSQRIQAKILSPEEKKSQIEKYYAESVTALIHIHLTVSQYKSNPQLICNKIGISEEKLEKELRKLSELHLIEFKNGKILRVDDSIHLSEESPLSFQNHINWRLKAIQRLQDQESKSGEYHLSVVFSADNETKQELRKLMQNLVVEAQKKVGSCERPTEVYKLMMDLF